MGYIIKFDGTQHAFLSNFYPSEITLDRLYLDKQCTDPKTWPMVENVFQATKTHNDTERELIRLATPGASKRLGRKCRLRDDWEIIKDEVMLECLRYKFSPSQGHADLREKLMATGDAILIEGNRWHDNYWGVCYCERCKGVGKNMLGSLLMKVRKEGI